MPPIADIMAVVFLGSLALTMLGLARLADRECRAFLEIFADERGITILRSRRLWLIPDFDGSQPMRVIYWLTAVDRQGRFLNGWGSVAVRFSRFEPTARRAQFRWVRVRAIPRPAAAPPRPPRDLLWDHWLDG